MSTKQQSKNHLKTLVNSSGSHRLRDAHRIMKYGTAGFTRNIWLSIAATLVMTVTLLILMITVFASLILSSTADTMREKIDITIFFAPGTTAETLTSLSTIMSTDPNVKNIEIADSATEYANFLTENADNADLTAALEDPAMYELMLTSMQATMRIKVHDTSDLSGIKNLVEHNEIFQTYLDPEKEPTYNVNQAEIETINSWASIAKNGGLILGAVFLVISVLVIFNTIRMAIYSRREEIYMMQLVGANTNFIRGPFLVEAQICGIISGLLASTLALVIFRTINPQLTAYGIDTTAVSQLMDTNLLVVVFAVMILAGIIIGTISARLAVQKYIKKGIR